MRLALIRIEASWGKLELCMSYIDHSTRKEPNKAPNASSE